MIMGWEAISLDSALVCSKKADFMEWKDEPSDWKQFGSCSWHQGPFCGFSSSRSGFPTETNFLRIRTVSRHQTSHTKPKVWLPCGNIPQICRTLQDTSQTMWSHFVRHLMAGDVSWPAVWVGLTCRILLDAWDNVGFCSKLSFFLKCSWHQMVRKCPAFLHLNPPSTIIAGEGVTPMYR